MLGATESELYSYMILITYQFLILSVSIFFL